MRNPEQIFDQIKNELEQKTENEFEIEKFCFLKKILKSIDPSQS